MADELDEKLVAQKAAVMAVWLVALLVLLMVVMKATELVEKMVGWD
jgi:hypothetical protein